MAGDAPCGGVAGPPRGGRVGCWLVVEHDDRLLSATVVLGFASFTSFVSFYKKSSLIY